MFCSTDADVRTLLRRRMENHTSWCIHYSSRLILYLHITIQPGKQNNIAILSFPYQNCSIAIGGKILYYKWRKCKNKNPNFLRKKNEKKKKGESTHSYSRVERAFSPPHLTGKVYSRKMSILLNWIRKPFFFLCLRTIKKSKKAVTAYSTILMFSFRHSDGFFFFHLSHLPQWGQTWEQMFFVFSPSPTVFISPMWLPFTSRRGCSRKAASMGRPVGQWVGKPESHRDNGPGFPVRWLTGRASNPPGSSQAFPAALGRKTLRKGVWRLGWGWPWWRLREPWKAKKKKSEVTHLCAQNRMRDRKTRDWLWPVGCDAGSHGHQSESQDEAQGEVDEGGAAQQHGQVEDGHQLQHPPALLRALARQQPLRNSTTHRSQSGITTRTVTVIESEKVYFFVTLHKQYTHCCINNEQIQHV